MSLIGYALRMAKKYYKPATYDHAIRVANYVAENKIIPEEKMDDCIALAIMHDLLEDTLYSLWIGAEDEIGKRFCDLLRLITHNKDTVCYMDYIKNLNDKSDEYPEAYWVKLADMKDHLAQTATLTDKLKGKYLEALSYLL